jgi:RNA polymerase sigma-B factor
VSGLRQIDFTSAEDADDERPVRELGVEDPGFAAAEDAATVSRLAAALSQRNREVLRLRFEHDLTQAEIGIRIGCSQMQVSRILRRAVARLQAQAAAELNTAA